MSTFDSAMSIQSDNVIPMKTAFLAKWVGATSAGFVVGAIALVFAASVVFRDDVFQLLGGPGSGPVLRALAMAGVGASVSTLQNFMLRPHIEDEFPWVVATAAGWSLGGLINTEIAILTTGTLQWLVIRRRRPPQSFLTLVANVAAVTVGTIAALVFLNLGLAIVTALLLASNESIQVGYAVVSAAALGLTLILAGGIYGVFTGSAQLFLLSSSATGETNTEEVR